MECITLLGTPSIQEYVFRSNRLRENAGASQLAAAALDDWRTRWNTYPGCLRFIYVGGGNAALLFASKQQAVTAVAKWSRELLERAPGLRVAAGHAEVENQKRYRLAYLAAIKDLFDCEDGAPEGSELGALPVVQTCASTGRAAAWHAYESWLSPEAFRKRREAEQAREQHVGFLKKWPLYTFPKEPEHLGMAEDASQIAIIHADGDGFGKLLREAGRERNLDGDDYLNEIAKLSEKIANAGKTAFQGMLDGLIEKLQALENDKVVRLRAASDIQQFLPLRPIIAAGDDLTFVCHGRLGLALAADYLKRFAAQVASLNGTASAGVAIVPLKFPFARAYELAEALCTSAKRVRKKWADEGMGEFCWLDFQLVMEGTAGELEFARQSLYGALIQPVEHLPRATRPYRLVENGDAGWHRFEDYWRTFQQWPRSRAKALLEAVTRGPGALGPLQAAYASRGFSLPGPPEALFDPLELLDFHVSHWMPKTREDKADAAVTH